MATENLSFTDDDFSIVDVPLPRLITLRVFLLMDDLLVRCVFFSHCQLLGLSSDAHLSLVLSADCHATRGDGFASHLRALAPMGRDSKGEGTSDSECPHSLVLGFLGLNLPMVSSRCSLENQSP